MANKSTPPFDDCPLVSILIPTHNRLSYLRQSLKSALGQTYPNLEIIVSDDNSNDDRIETFMHTEVHDSRISYFHHKGLGFQRSENITWLLSHFHGEYFQLLMDDDLIAPEKIEMMVACYQECPTATLVTSYRQVIDGEGNKLPDLEETARLTDEPTLFRGAAVRQKLLQETLNFLGEPSTVLLRRDCQAQMLDIWTTYHANADLVTWLALCEQGDVVYLPQPLSFFRHHEGQDQNDLHTKFEGYCEWCHIFLHAIEQETDDEQKRAYWQRYFTHMEGLISILLPTLRTRIFAERESFAAREQMLALEGTIAQVQRHFEQVVFPAKETVFHPYSIHQEA
ncbi:MAG: glycosyltransferase [Veillonellaceae bacterium]|nr:glycosyltransferase [Veillonellaceae bacterium]MDD6127939.1 glycosyltransferase [Veillonellaceae bacterium]MDD6699139.1 glycosyltransferase [Veillonellaceae bacterium]